MALGLGARSRRLVARLSDGPAVRAAGLVWCSRRVAVDRSALRPGEVVVCDHVIERHRPGDVDSGVYDERFAAAGVEGVVYAWDGVTVIGRVHESEGGGVLLYYAWPEGAADVVPGGRCSAVARGVAFVVGSRVAGAFGRDRLIGVDGGECVRVARVRPGCASAVRASFHAFLCAELVAYVVVDFRFLRGLLRRGLLHRVSPFSAKRPR